MVGSEVLKARPVQNVSQALQGVIPGLNVSTTNSGGALDGTMNINIRGTGTIGEGSGSSPLILIDGIEGNLNTVNPNDIESVSVLKDAASASIYGARASFGVILVTTKSGKSGKAKVSYSGNVRFNDAIAMPEMMDSYTFAQYFNRAASNSGRTPVFTDPVLERIKGYQDGTFTAATVDDGNGRWSKWKTANGNTDWFAEFYKNWVPSHEHNLSVSGGTERIQYLVSGSLLDQNGLIRHGEDRFQRYTLNSKISSQVTDWFRIVLSNKWTREDFARPTYLTKHFFIICHVVGLYSRLTIPTAIRWRKQEYSKWRWGVSRIARRIFIRTSCVWFLSRLKTGILIWKEAFVLQPITGIGQSFRFMDMTWRVIPLLSHGIWDIAHMLRELQEWMNTRGRKIIILPTFIRIT